MGLPPNALREVSRAYVANPHQAANLISVSLLVTAAAAAALITFLNFTPSIVVEKLGGNSQVVAIIKIAAWGALFYSCLKVLVEGLKAIRYPKTGLFLEYVLVPLGLLSIIGFAEGGSLKQLESGHVMWSHVSWLLVGVLVAYAIVKIRFRQTGNYEPKWHITLSTLAVPRELFDLWLLHILTIVFMTAPLIILPQLQIPEEEIGHFGLAFRLVAIAGTIIASLSGFYSPRFAVAATGPQNRLKEDHRQSQLYSLLVYLPLFIAFMVFPNQILRWFGEGFQEAAILLRVMAAGELVNAATGLVAQALIMTNRERVTIRASLISLGLMTLGIVTLGVYWGAIGVAISYAGGIACRNILLFHYLYRAQD
jgi:O-antigen/teichoic acid export membrane protein